MPRARLSRRRSQGVPTAAGRSGCSHRASFLRGLPRVHLAPPERLKGHLPTNRHPQRPGSAESALRTPPAHVAAQRPASARRASPARGESGSPLTAPTRRHWKSFRTSSQLCTPSLRVDPTRARRRRQQQPARQVCASIIGVLVAPSHVVDSTLPARPALQALENARRSRFPKGASWLQAFRGRSGTPASPGALGFLPRSSEAETPEFSSRAPRGLPLRRGRVGAEPGRKRAGAARSRRASGSGHRSRSRGLSQQQPTWDAPARRAPRASSAPPRSAPRPASAPTPRPRRAAPRGPTQDRPPSGPAWIEETNK